jgi:transcriptional regulator with XRE-family HTH domain
MRKTKNHDAKLPEVLRLMAFMQDCGVDADELAEVTGVAKRTLTNYLWHNQPLGAQLLRQLHALYKVSVDWLLTGAGEMYVGGRVAVTGQRRLIRPDLLLDNTALGDVYVLVAGVIERSLLDSGAEAGVDYGYVDLFKLAQAHVLDEAKKTPLKVNYFQG